MEISPASVEVDSEIKGDLTLTYTANTATAGNIVINPAGIVLEDPEDTDSTMFLRSPTVSGTYGVVRSSSSSSKGALSVEDNEITWSGVNLKANDKLIATIRNTIVTSDPGNYEWETTVDEQPLLDDKTTGDVTETAVFTVVKTSEKSVKFDGRWP